MSAHSIELAQLRAIRENVRYQVEKAIWHLEGLSGARVGSAYAILRQISKDLYPADAPIHIPDTMEEVA